MHCSMNPRPALRHRESSPSPTPMLPQPVFPVLPKPDHLVLPILSQTLALDIYVKIPSITRGCNCYIPFWAWPCLYLPKPLRYIPSVCTAKYCCIFWLSCISYFVCLLCQLEYIEILDWIGLFDWIDLYVSLSCFCSYIYYLLLWAIQTIEFKVLI